MKPILKKSLIIGSSIVIPIGLIGLGFGVYFATPIVQRISTKGIFSIRVNENLNNEGYKFDYSTSYGTPTSTNRLSLLLNNEILHLKTSGKFKYKQAIKNQNGEIISPAEVEQPSYESLKFANANGIVLTFISTDLKEQDITPTFFSKEQKFRDGTKKYFQLVFDNDDDEITPEQTTKDQVVVTKISKKAKSINNPNVFGKIIANGFLDKEINLDELNEENPNINTSSKNYILASLGVTFNTNAKWVDSNGNETKYNISPRDMLYSAKRTWLFDKTYRRSHGGSKELDQYFIEKTQTIKIFGETQKYPNEYLFDFFGVNTNKLYDEKWAIQKVNTNKETEEKFAYTFSFNIFEKNGNINKNFSFSAVDIIKKYLSNSLHFSLAPSQYIDELAKNDSINKTPKGNIEGEARDFGIYTYAQTRETTLFASTYIPTSASAGREIYEYNKHYANSKWLDSVEKGDKEGYKTINKVIIEYAGSIDSSTFINQSFYSFLNGTLSQVDYALLTEAQKQKLYGNGKDQNELITNSKKNGLQVTKKVNISTMTSRMVWQANPINNLGINSYKFKNNYAKLVYGSSIEEISQGKATTSNSFYAGLGFDFRLLIQASINWYQYIQQAYGGTRDVWLSGAAQNAMFSSFEDSLTPADFNEKGMNDLIYFADGKEQTVTLNEMKKLSNSSKEEIEKEYGPDAAHDLQLTKMKSPHYKQIQNAVKKVLDNFYNQDGINKSEKIEMDIAYPFADQDNTKVKATKFIVENIINGLDNRIKAKFVKPTTRDEMINAINQRKGAFNANLWSYDYEGIGSYISGYTSDGSGINIVNAFGIFSKNPENDPESLFQDKIIENIKIKRPTKETIKRLQKSFPKFTELSKFVREKMNNELNKESNTRKADDSLQVENWDLINNNENNNIIKFFNQKWSDKDNTWIPDKTKNPNQINPVSTLSAIFKMFEAEASWQKNNNNTDKKESAGQGWADLIKELNAIKGVSIDTESSVERLENVNYILYLREYVVPLSKYGLQVYSDITYKK